MAKTIHGGDIYRNNVELDYSVNINPLGIPEVITKALQKAVFQCGEYPDIHADGLKKAVSEALSVPQEYLVFGNGASELFMALVHALQPEKTVIPVPSFYGYEYAAGAVPGAIVYYEMKEENMFCPGSDFLDVLTEDVDLLFLAYPNNPTGQLLPKEYLIKLLTHCKNRKIVVVLDECFIEFCGTEASMLSEIDRFDNLLIVRAFTKIFAIPGVRLGYLVSSNQQMLGKIRRQLPEWNLSTFAQAVSCVCEHQQEYVSRTVELVKAERAFLEGHLKDLGFRVFPGNANFILFYGEPLLYEQLLKRGVLIRDCSNYRGLKEGYYRIAVRKRQDNEKLVKIMAQVPAKRATDIAFE